MSSDMFLSNKGSCTARKVTSKAYLVVVSCSSAHHCDLVLRSRLVLSKVNKASKTSVAVAICVSETSAINIGRTKVATLVCGYWLQCINDLIGWLANERDCRTTNFDLQHLHEI
jgi:hypothetical protein